MKTIFLFSLILYLSSCALIKKVHQEDFDAWENVDLIELETHPIFSTMPMRKQDLSDGTTLYIYTNSASNLTPTSCRSNSYGTTTCYGGQEETISCSNQFFVKHNKVLKYRALGDCYTNCISRPTSKPCK